LNVGKRLDINSKYSNCLIEDKNTPMAHLSHWGVFVGKITKYVGKNNIIGRNSSSIIKRKDGKYERFA
jgi:hypothetical protein